MKAWQRICFIAAVVIITGPVAALIAGQPASADLNAQFKAFLLRFEAQARPLFREKNVASFMASVSGKDDDFKRSAELQIAYNKLFTGKDDFALLKACRAPRAISDPLLKRQLDILYLAFLGNQIDEKKLSALVNQQTRIEQKFNTFRATINGKTCTDNDIEEILKTSTDANTLQSAWQASKKIGPLVATDIMTLVKLRNQVASELGFANFHDMQITLGEQNPAEIEALFDELDTLTRSAFVTLKSEIDANLASRNHITIGDLRPWHYQDRFFQAAPKIYVVDLDSYYHDRRPIDIAQAYYLGIGLDITPVIGKSDLYEKPGKYQHAFSSDIDHQGDVRVLESIKPNKYWMDTTLHEFGHSAYAYYNDPALPWLLRDSAHAFTTEAIANMFGRFAANPVWLHDMLAIPASEVAKIAGPSFQSLRLEQLVFSRWAQVMYRFERQMYQNPDQDLNKLWWNLVEKYQLMIRPEQRNEPDWATKIHIALYPAYYHNYLMGELLASQLYATVAKKVLHVADKDLFAQSFVKQKAVGAFLIDKVFRPGMRYPWNEMIERATGEKLTAAYYARQFVTGK